VARHTLQSSIHPWRRVLVALAAGVLMAAVFATAGCTKAAETTAPSTAATETQEAPAAEPVTPTETVAAVTALEIDDLKKGKGDKVKAGDTVSVHYTGWLLDGTKFDSSVDRGQPFEFVVGQGLVIAGWDQGLVGMQKGGKRVLVIPSDMGYGDAGTPDGTIPPGATLKFEIELLDINP